MTAWIGWMSYGGECAVVRMGKMVGTGCRGRCIAMNGCSIEEYCRED
jgi:hypothetical protein